MVKSENHSKVFVDSSFFIALSDRSSRYFSHCEEAWEILVTDRAPLVTSNLIFSETLTFLRYHAGFKVAKAFGEAFRRSKAVHVIWADSEWDELSWKIFLKYHDQKFSYVDCMSFAVMQRYEILEALSLDRDFVKAGFNLYPLTNSS